MRLSRRSVLRGAGISVALPWLEAMSPAGRVAQAAVPKRFVFFFQSNGHIRDAWLPTGTETNFTLGRTMAALETYKSDIIVIDGMENSAAENGPGDDHMKGMGCMLTGTELLPGDIMGGGGTPSGLAGGISLDQEIVKQLQPKTKFPSLELGVQSGDGGTPWSYSNYRGSNQPLPLENSPKAAFTRLFTDFAAPDDSAVKRLRADRKSVLDAVTRSYKVLNSRLGADDRQRLDAHLTAVQELEARLLTIQPSAATACRRPAAPTTAADGRGNDNMPLVGKMQMDHLVMALACDMTRVGTIQWSASAASPTFTWLGITQGHHALGHEPESNAEAQESLVKIDTWYMEQFAYLVGRLKAIPEEGGTMLDNTLILFANELSRGNAHSHDHMQCLLAGRAGGKVRTGRFLKYPKTTQNNLYVSILNAFDIPATTFGNKAYCTGPLSGFA